MKMLVVPDMHTDCVSKLVLTDFITAALGPKARVQSAGSKSDHAMFRTTFLQY